MNAVMAMKLLAMTNALKGWVTPLYFEMSNGLAVLKDIIDELKLHVTMTALPSS